MSTRLPISLSDIESISEAFFSSEARRIAKNAVTSQGVEKVSRVPEAIARMTNSFDIEVKQGAPTNQRRSGRCWMFAALNTMRTQVIKKYNLDTFEFSEAYPLFFDKLEKSNWFLWNVLETADEPVEGRLLDFLLRDPVGDGGQWDMFRAIIEKYGIVPKDAMPETACSEATGDMNSYLTRYLRKCAMTLRETHAKGKSLANLNELRLEMLANVQQLLITCLGQPPREFDVLLKDVNEKITLSGRFTPREFFEEVIDMELSEYVSVISAPMHDKPFYHTYKVDRLGNVVEAGGVRYLNLPPSELKRAALAQLSDGLPVWFGCDVMQCFLDDDGILGIDTLDIDGLFGFPIVSGFDKSERLTYRESKMTHAMVFDGVSLGPGGKPTKWKVENSWGKDHGRDGFELMSDEWFDEYVYQIAVHRKYLTPLQRQIFDTESPKVLSPWDPIGALASIV